MERDSLLGHGVAYMLQDRLLRCSDYHKGLCREPDVVVPDRVSAVNVCKQCGSIISAIPSGMGAAECTACKAASCTLLTVPYVFTYLVNELAAMNVRIRLRLQ